MRMRRAEAANYKIAKNKRAVYLVPPLINCFFMRKNGIFSDPSVHVATEASMNQIEVLRRELAAQPRKVRPVSLAVLGTTMLRIAVLLIAGG